MAAPAEPPPGMPLKQKMATGLKALLGGARRLAIGDDGSSAPPAKMDELFAKTDPSADGEDCLHDCDSCSAEFPRGFKIDESDRLYGHVRGWSTHVLVATGKTDWVRDVTHEKGSVMQAIGNARSPSNGRLMLSASNMPTPHHATDYSEPTTVLLLPAFIIIDNATPAAVPKLIADFIEKAPTNTSPLAPVSLPRTLPEPPAASDHPAPELPPAAAGQLLSRSCPHRAIILLCSQKTRDARCGQSAPVLRKELERHLRPLGLYRDLDDGRPGGVGIYFISHVGGHKYSANMMVYRRPDAFGLDEVERAKLGEGEVLTPRKAAPAASGGEKEGEDEEEDVGAAQCIWLARIRPEDCENIVRYTVLQGKVLKPERQLRGGFDRGKGLLSW